MSDIEQHNLFSCLDTEVFILVQRGLDQQKVKDLLATFRALSANRPVTITFDNCLGGEITDEFIALVDLIVKHKGVVKTVILNRCCSAGVALFLAGHYRTMRRDAKIEDHDVIINVSLSLLTAEGQIPQDLFLLAKKVKKFVFELYRTRTKIPLNILPKVFSRDVVFNSEQALNSGLIHKIE